MNTYVYARHSPPTEVDSTGLDVRLETTAQIKGLHQRITVDTPLGPYGVSFGTNTRADAITSQWLTFSHTPPTKNGKGSGEVYRDADDPLHVVKLLKTTPQEDMVIAQYLQSMQGFKGAYSLHSSNCRDFSQAQFEIIKEKISSMRSTANHLSLEER